MYITIYALRDPRNNEVRYVGQARNPRVRLAQHVADAAERGPLLKNWWIAGLIMRGLAPHLIPLEATNQGPRVAYQRECFWMHYYVDRGHDVLNHQGLHTRLPSVKRRARQQLLLTEDVRFGELIGQRSAVQALYQPDPLPPRPDPIAVLPDFIATCVVFCDYVTTRTQLYNVYGEWWWTVPNIGNPLSRPRFETAFTSLVAGQGVSQLHQRWQGVSVSDYMNQQWALWDARQQHRGYIPVAPTQEARR